MTIIDKEWEDGDDSAREDEAYEEGRKSLAYDMMMMLSDLVEALREEMEYHDEPSQHLVDAVRSWTLRLHELGFMEDFIRDAYLSMTRGEEEDDD